MPQGVAATHDCVFVRQALVSVDGHNMDIDDARR